MAHNQLDESHSAMYWQISSVQDSCTFKEAVKTYT